jgi:hypothetical protein
MAGSHSIGGWVDWRRRADTHAAPDYSPTEEPGLHYNCNSLRGIHLASPTEINVPFLSKPRALLEKVAGIEFVEPAHWDECCGFGGTFSVFEPQPVSTTVSERTPWAP